MWKRKWLDRTHCSKVMCVLPFSLSLFVCKCERSFSCAEILTNEFYDLSIDCGMRWRNEDVASAVVVVVAFFSPRLNKRICGVALDQMATSLCKICSRFYVDCGMLAFKSPFNFCMQLMTLFHSIRRLSMPNEVLNLNTRRKVKGRLWVTCESMAAIHSPSFF